MLKIKLNKSSDCKNLNTFPNYDKNQDYLLNIMSYLNVKLLYIHKYSCYSYY